MRAPHTNALEAIQRVAGRAEGDSIREYLQGELDLVRGFLVNEADSVKLRVWQGQAQVLETLLRVWKP